MSKSSEADYPITPGNDFQARAEKVRQAPHVTELCEAVFRELGGVQSLALDLRQWRDGMMVKYAKDGTASPNPGNPNLRYYFALVLKLTEISTAHSQTSLDQLQQMSVEELKDQLVHQVQQLGYRVLHPEEEDYREREGA